jgi:hypothetical protein
VSLFSRRRSASVRLSAFGLVLPASVVVVAFVLA